MCRFVWKDKVRQWEPRKRKFAIGRIWFCGPKAGELYYLRLLLHHVPGATCWEDLKRVPGEIQPRPTFREPCLGRELLESDQQWHSCLMKAAGIEKSSGMRQLFAVILSESSPANPLELWEEHKVNICDDCAYILLRKYGITTPSAEHVFSLGLCYLREILRNTGSDLAKVGLPEPTYCHGARRIEARMVDYGCCAHMRARLFLARLSLWSLISFGCLSLWLSTWGSCFCASGCCSGRRRAGYAGYRCMG
jgi:hypothetical protein